MKPLSGAQQRALVFLSDAGGSGVVTKSGFVLAAGETKNFAGSTWLRLVSRGLVMGGDGRIQLSSDGRFVAQELAAKGIRP